MAESDGTDWGGIFSGAISDYFEYKTADANAESYRNGDRNQSHTTPPGGVLTNNSTQRPTGQGASASVGGLPPWAMGVGLAVVALVVAVLLVKR